MTANEMTENIKVFPVIALITLEAVQESIGQPLSLNQLKFIDAILLKFLIDLQTDFDLLQLTLHYLPVPFEGSGR
jgi:hypothetical protein